MDGAPVIEELLIRLPLSLELALLATLVSVLIAIPLGMLAAARQDTWVDYVVRVMSIGGLAIPSFWVGILCILLLVIFFGWGPPLEFTPPWVDPWANFQMMVWPVLTVGYRYAAVTTRMTRSTMLEVLREDYIRTAWAKGLQERAVVIRHALKNSMLPVITLIGTEFAFLIGGLVVTETVFTLNGVGRFLVDAVAHRDYPVVQALDLPDRLGFVMDQPPGRPDLRLVRSPDPVPVADGHHRRVDATLDHAPATARLAPELTVREEIAKFVSTKPLGAAGAAIILGDDVRGLLRRGDGAVRSLRRRTTASSSRGRAPSTGSARTSSGATC